MCGFAGIFSPNRPLMSADIAIAERVCDRQAYRGPDACGQEIGLHFAVFHRKLSITTGGADSDQPFVRRGVQCAFAGEIYNHKTLAVEIGAPESAFDGHVIPAGFAREGPRFLGKLEGEYAIAIRDPREKAIVLSRDRAGARNLYFARTDGGCWIFSTELSALVREYAINPRLDEEAMLCQLLLQEWSPRVGTWFESIHQVAPGTTVTLGNALPQVEPYPPFSDGMKSRADLLARAVKERLEHARTASGCLALSGGLDSTAIAALSDFSDSPMHTFTVIGDLSDPIAVRVRRLAVKMPWLQPNMVVLGGDEISDSRLTDLTLEIASPVCDTTPFALAAMFREARDRGFQYCMSGEGADDLWAGYSAEAAYVSEESVATAYISLIDRVSANCFGDFRNGSVRKVPIIHRDAAEELARRLGSCVAHLGSSAKMQSQQVAGRPLAVLSVLGPLRRSLEQVDCLAGRYSMEARVPFCSAALLSVPWQADWCEGKQWIRDILPESISASFDWTKESFATRRFNDTALSYRLDDLVDEILATKGIWTFLDKGVDGSVLRMLATANSKLWWSMIGIARFSTVYARP
ncbi:asparagine synthetase B family protein [Burkholderia cenocepacia]|uniref:asparagine synthetase B family protein n=1 Tax=Burkholderia cenocepacia TaxID=95486 RepID=UPI00158B5D6E|nr:asparagine synthetase B family protein [Burkholderia cenocepacia]